MNYKRYQNVYLCTTYLLYEAYVNLGGKTCKYIFCKDCKQQIVNG